MEHTFILNTRVITPENILPNYCVEIQNGKIAALFPHTKLQSLPKGADVIEAHDAYCAPGLIDMHIHGFAGAGVELGTAQALLKMSEALHKVGVTSFCPTLYCAQPRDMMYLIQHTVTAFGKEKGAHLIGYHLEGPFISPLKPGVMKPRDISPIQIPVLEQLYKAAKGHITSMTIAPELPGIEQVVAFCKKHHILLQAGHTNATYEEFLKGAKLGITHTTHLFNAMSSFNHRAPGAAGAVLLHPDISAEIIADGVHVHPDVVSFLSRVKPIKNIVLVTDALLPTHQGKAPFIANGEEVVFDKVWKRKSDQVIAGSGLTMLRGIENLVAWGYTLPQAVACASTNPARLLGLSHKGSLEIGKDADIVLFDDHFRPIQTLLA